MKSVNEIRNMIEEARHGRSDDGGMTGYVPTPHRISEILVAILDHVDGLHADVLDCDKRINKHIGIGSLPSPPKCLAVRDGVDYAIAERCDFAIGHKGSHSWAFSCESYQLGRSGESGQCCKFHDGHEGAHSYESELCGWVMIPGEKCTLPRDHEGPHRNWPPAQDYADHADEMMKHPHSFQLGRTRGEASNQYEVCICGLSRGNVIHLGAQADIPKFHTMLAQAAWKEQRIKDLAAAIHGHIAIRGAEPIIEGEDLDIVGGWIDELKTLWESM